MAKEDFIREWLDLPDKDPQKLSKYTIDNDRWDRKFVNQMFDTLDDFLVNHDLLEQHVETGSPMWSDLYWLLYKYEPESLPSGQVRPSHLLNFLVGEEILGLPEYQKLKFFSEGNDVVAAMTCIDMRETLEQLFDKLKTLRDKLKKIMDEMSKIAAIQQQERDLEEMIEQWRNGMNPDMPDPDSPEGQAKQDELDQQKQDLEQQRQEMEDALQEQSEELSNDIDAARTSIANDLGDALEDAADQAEGIHSQQDLMGDLGTDLMRLPAEERMRLAKRLQNPSFKRLLDLIGPMRRIMEEAQLRKTDTARDEVHRITIGDDLARVLPSEMMLLGNSNTKLEFFRKYVEKSLPQYELRGKEKVGKGEIIACLDNSGSMAGDKEMWGKAVAICALHLARKQKRGFYGIHFGSAHQIKTFDFGVNAEITPNMVIDYAEFFFNGGTNFTRPLSLAVDRLRDEHEATGKTKGDIMFITDGLDRVEDSWMKKFKEEQARLEFKVFGFLIGGFGKDAEPLNEICDGQIWTVKDLLDPTDTKDMFGAI